MLAFGLGADPRLRAALSAHLAFELVEIVAEELLAVIDTRDVAVVLVGPALSAVATAALLGALARERPAVQTKNIILTADEERDAFQELVDRGQLFYVCDAGTRAADVAELVVSALAPEPGTVDRVSVAPSVRRRVFACVRGLSASSRPGTAAGIIAQTIEDVLRVERASVLFYDSAEETISRPTEDAVPAARESAASGLVAFAARTASVVCVPCAGEDPRYDRACDDPEGRGDERLLAVPCAGSVGILVVIRSAGEPDFSQSELDVIQYVVGETSPVLARLLAESTLDAQEHRHFRAEALAHHLGTDDGPGELLRLSSGWTSVTYALLVAALAVAVVCSLAFRVNEYASGPAVVRFEDKTSVTSTRDGIIASFSARPGELVTKGQSLVRLVDGAEASEAERRTQEFELGLVALLRDPLNDPARTQLATARVQRDAAKAALAERTVRAPRDGIVSAIHVRVGQKVNAGDVLASLVGDNDVTVVALLPARYRAELKQGTSLRFQLAGYEHVYQTTPLASIGEVVSAPEAARYLGLEGGSADQGPVVVVSGRIQRATYVSGGQTYRYHDGMPGTVDVRVRSEPALLALIPALRTLLVGDP